MAVFAFIFVVCLVLVLNSPAKALTKAKVIVKEPVRDYSDRPYGSVKYLEDM